MRGAPAHRSARRQHGDPSRSYRGLHGASECAGLLCRDPVEASLTDAIDGYLARSRNWVTTFGKLMDPIADKLLIVAALIALVSLARLEAWVAMVIIAREFAVSGLRVAAGQQGVVIPASPLGKLKTVVQVAAIFAVIATDAEWARALLYVAVVVTLVSGADYFLNFRKKIEEARERVERRAAAGDGA